MIQNIGMDSYISSLRSHIMYLTNPILSVCFDYGKRRNQLN
jgi:hypothetical protein